MEKTMCHAVEFVAEFGKLMEKNHLPSSELDVVKEKLTGWMAEYEEEGGNLSRFARAKFVEQGWLGRNTEITYLYRDADNYKVWNSCRVKGVITPEQVQQIVKCCDSGEFFIPEKVGLPEETFGSWTEADHPWFEIIPEQFHETDQEEQVDLTVDQLVANFQKCEGKWEQEEKPEEETPSSSVISISNFAPNPMIKLELDRHMAIRTICLDLCYSIPGYATADLEIKNFVYDRIRECLGSIFM